MNAEVPVFPTSNTFANPALSARSGTYTHWYSTPADVCPRKDKDFDAVKVGSVSITGNVGDPFNVSCRICRLYVLSLINKGMEAR